MENKKQYSLPPCGIIAVYILQVILTKERKIPLTGFGWLEYLKSAEGQRRLKKLEVGENIYEKTLE